MLKKFAIVFVLMIVFVGAACADSLYTATINDTTVQTAQDTAIEVMTGKNFSIDTITPYKVVFTKSFGDGFWTVCRLCYVNFNFLERDGNVKLMVSETEKLGAIVRARSINHMVPIIQEIKSEIDGTPIENVANEAVDQLPGSGNQRAKSLGIKLGDEYVEQGIRIINVEPGSLAADAGLLATDLIMEVNGRSVKDMTPKALRSYLANKMAAGSSIMLGIDRTGETKLIIIKTD